MKNPPSLKSYGGQCRTTLRGWEKLKRRGGGFPTKILTFYFQPTKLLTKKGGYYCVGYGDVLSEEKHMKYATVITVFVIALLQGCTPRNDTASKEPQSRQAVDEGFANYCKTHECRKNLKVHLKKADGSYLNTEMEFAQPIVQGNLVSIFPGETVYIAFDPGPKGPENLRSVESAGNSAHILTFKLTQEGTLADGAGMMLFVHNSSNRYIK